MIHEPLPTIELGLADKTKWSTVNPLTRTTRSKCLQEDPLLHLGWSAPSGRCRVLADSPPIHWLRQTTRHYVTGDRPLGVFGARGLARRGFRLLSYNKGLCRLLSTCVTRCGGPGIWEREREREGGRGSSNSWLLCNTRAIERFFW